MKKKLHREEVRLVSALFKLRLNQFISVDIQGDRKLNKF